MFQRMFLFFSVIACMSISTKAESDICTAAKDSAAIFINKGDLAFYYPSKTNPNLYNFIRISKAYYQKTPVRMAAGNKDTSRLSKYAILKEAYEKNVERSQPLDTSNEYKKCFNKAVQATLDSTFKCDFFRKADSIMGAYDKSGRGYNGVEFPGGVGGLQKFFTQNLSLPEDVTPDDSSKIIRVLYTFFVDEKGNISEISVSKSNCKVCEAPILKTIQKMPAFLPAREAGKPKKVKYILPYIKAIKPNRE